ncbi:Nucleolar protein 4, partial [Ophiophagus hannah]
MSQGYERHELISFRASLEVTSYQKEGIAETYAFLPREAVTRFLMSCTECQKRMHFNSNGVEPKENESPSSLVSGIIDYNMPLTSTYLKQMKLRVMNSQEQILVRWMLAGSVL